ncbi:MAG: hypothetical protein KGM92_04985 [Acidobacteriota bacterium]|nr:hypothetical protein [Acidobacteriota bacterium]
MSALAHSYSEQPSGTLFVIEGSTGHLEVSLGQESAAAAIGCQTGATVELRVL